MSRAALGSVYESRGVWYVAITGAVRRHYRLGGCRTAEDAGQRAAVLADFARRLKLDGRASLIDAVCTQAAVADRQTLAGLETIVTGLLTGTEHLAPPVTLADVTRGPCPTLREFAKLWTSNDLARNYHERIQEIQHTNNILQLKKHIY